MPLAWFGVSPDPGFSRISVVFSRDFPPYALASLDGFGDRADLNFIQAWILNLRASRGSPK